MRSTVALPCSRTSTATAGISFSRLGPKGRHEGLVEFRGAPPQVSKSSCTGCVDDPRFTIPALGKNHIFVAAMAPPSAPVPPPGREDQWVPSGQASLVDLESLAALGLRCRHSESAWGSFPRHRELRCDFCIEPNRAK